MKLFDIDDLILFYIPTTQKQWNEDPKLAMKKAIIDNIDYLVDELIKTGKDNRYTQSADGDVAQLKLWIVR